METAIHSSAKILHEQTEKIILQELSTQQNVGGHTDIQKLNLTNV